jgi:hypothetical protein
MKKLLSGSVHTQAHLAAVSGDDVGVAVGHHGVEAMQVQQVCRDSMQDEQYSGTWSVPPKSIEPPKQARQAGAQPAAARVPGLQLSPAGSMT